MSKLYCAYALFDSFDDKRKFEISHNLSPIDSVFDKRINKERSLYAWTKNKSLFESFVSTRKGLIYDTKKVDDDEVVESFTNFYSNIEIIDYDFMHYKNRKKSIKQFPTTLRELYSISNYKLEIIGEEMINSCKSPYITLNDEYIHALDNILYTLYHDKYYPDTEYPSDMVDFNESQGRTPYGKSLNKILMDCDEFNLFHRVYEDLLNI